MAVAFPPEPVFPLAIDSDRTLYLVYNTTETRLAENNQAWAEEIAIVPVGADDPEIWADNGFGTIEGELFYYDDVSKNANGKVFLLRRIARNLGGKQTKFNTAGVWVRSYIIAEHHNQLVDAICRIEKYIGVECSEEDLAACGSDLTNDTLDCKIRRLFQEPPCTDDHGCPVVDFAFEIVSDDPCEGTVVQFNVGITGNFTQYQLDFGDGNSTTSEQNGTHTYAPNATIDPVVNVANTDCQVVQTPVARVNPNEPEELPVATPFEVPIPVTPDFPTIIIPDIDLPATTLEFPQILFPCLTAGGLEVPSVITINPPIPSVIDIPPITIPSVIIIDPPIPSVIIIDPEIPSIILFGPVSIPSVIFFGPNPLPAVILFGPAPPLGPVLFGPAPTIGFGPAPSMSPVEFGPAPSVSPVEFGPSPTVSVDWGTPPTCSCTVSVVCPGASPMAARAKAQSLFVDDDFIDGFDSDIGLDLDQETNFGIPSEIKVLAPEIPDVKLVHDLPTKITVEVPKIPDIKILSPEIPLPAQIELVNKTNIPKKIMLDASSVPESIKVEMPVPIPQIIKVEVPKEFPTIKIDASGIPDRIKVVGIPESIEVKSNIPDKIVAEFQMPEDTKVPLVYEGGPIPVKFSEANITDDNGDVCFRLVPCNPK
jgi:PKD repeat protein